ncbi:MAG: RNA polymerase sigma factor [Candidatus Cyclobacteriaceae bacterium M3_2C_046]
MTKKESALIQAIISARHKGEEGNYYKQVNELIKFYNDNYKIKIVNVIRKKYTLNHDEKEEAAKDLYSEAMAIFLKTIHEKVDILHDLKYENYFLGICRYLHYDRIRKNKEEPGHETHVFEKQAGELKEEETPFELEQIQQQVEKALIDYYEENNMFDCLKILYYSWKKELKNPEIAKLLNLEIADQKEASRRITVIQQNCIKNAWRNIGLLHEVKKDYHIKKRKKIYWRKNAGNK